MGTVLAVAFEQETIGSAPAPLSGSYDLFFELSEEAKRL
jgi:hypothetical protein